MPKSTGCLIRSRTRCKALRNKNFSFLFTKSRSIIVLFVSVNELWLLIVESNVIIIVLRTWKLQVWNSWHHRSLWVDIELHNSRLRYSWGNRVIRSWPRGRVFDFIHYKKLVINWLCILTVFGISLMAKLCSWCHGVSVSLYLAAA